MSSPSAADHGWFGHPRGLSTLFFTEMWERFSFYGMRAILLLFMTAAVEAGGLGWDAAKAGPIYGLYTALVYLSALPGGWIADRILGQRRTVFWGGVVIAAGHVFLMFHGVPTFFFGLFLIVIGTGWLKPNVSTLVGSLYTENDARRDAGFSVFYMGINLGAFIAPLVVGFLAQHSGFKTMLAGWGLRPEDSWHWGFGAAAVGMMIGVIQYAIGSRRFGAIGLLPATAGDPVAAARDRRTLALGVGAFVALAVGIAALNMSGAAAIGIEQIVRGVGYALIIVPVVFFAILLARKDWTPVERKRLLAVPLLFLFACLFWSAFEQAGSTFNLFAERNTRNAILGLEFPASWLQSVNAIFIIAFAPVFGWLWLRLGKREPSSPAKFAYGLFFAGLGFLVVAFAALASGPAGEKVSPMWLVTVYLCHTFGELCLSPVGLSTMTKLAPPRVTGQMMGVWFLAISVGNFIGGQIAGLFETLPLSQIFFAVAGVCMVCTVIAVVLVKPIRGLMSGVH
jgi:POT family proton-dependent oligopeptide transporter